MSKYKHEHALGHISLCENGIGLAAWPLEYSLSLTAELIGDDRKSGIVNTALLMARELFYLTNMSEPVLGLNPYSPMHSNNIRDVAIERKVYRHRTQNRQ